MTRLRLLWLALAGGMGFLGAAYEGKAAVADNRQTLFLEFLPNLENASITFDRWRKQQPSEFSRWAAFRAAIDRGETPTPPTMSTRFGKMIVAAGKMAIGTVTPIPPQPPFPALYPSLTVFPSEHWTP